MIYRESIQITDLEVSELEEVESVNVKLFREDWLKGKENNWVRLQDSVFCVFCICTRRSHLHAQVRRLERL